MTLRPLILLLLLSTPLSAADYQRRVVYEIFIDRFFDGDPTNNDPPQSHGLYDSTKRNWQLYWGGDLEGIRQKLDYLKTLGVGAIWITPPTDNVNVSVSRDPGHKDAAYHGYHARDFLRIEEHFGDASNSWHAFDRLVREAHHRDMQVIVDIVPNHSNRRTVGEFGRVYRHGKLFADPANDPTGMFHHTPNKRTDDDPYEVQYYHLNDLADLDQINPSVDAYLKEVARTFQKHGADGFRIDAIKHVDWGWIPSYANSIMSNRASFLFGEWMQVNTKARLFGDSVNLFNRSGISLLDFPLSGAIREAFAHGGSFKELAPVIAEEDRAFANANSLVTFFENHDIPRFQSLNGEQARLHQALAFLLTCRGVPVLYQGVEQYLHNDTNGGKDPYDRPIMERFDTRTPAFKLIQDLARLRWKSPAIAYGSFEPLLAERDLLVYQRKFRSSVALVAIHRGTEAQRVTGLRSALPTGHYTDEIHGKLAGPPLVVGDDGKVEEFTLLGNSVGIWSWTSVPAGPQAGSLWPSRGQPGMQVTIAGRGFGSMMGEVRFGSVKATVISWAPDEILARVPQMPSGTQLVSVATAGAETAAGKFEVLAAKLIPVAVTWRIRTEQDGKWIVSTSDATLGQMLRDPAAPSRLVLTISLPAGQEIELHISGSSDPASVKSVVRYRVPLSGVGILSNDSR